jgi:hypothetical protein
MALADSGFVPLIDPLAISGGDGWKRRQCDLISMADAVILLLSPHAVSSQTCAWTLEEAARLRTRLIPALSGALGGTANPKRLHELGYVHLYTEPDIAGSGFYSGIKAICETLRTVGAAPTRTAARVARHAIAARNARGPQYASIPTRTGPAPLFGWVALALLAILLFGLAWRSDGQRALAAERTLVETARKNHALNAFARNRCSARPPGTCGW